MKKIVFPFIVLLLFVFVSCEEKVEDEYLYLDDEAKSYIPFEGGEQFHFILNGKIPLTLKAESKLTTTSTEVSSVSLISHYKSQWITLVDSNFNEVLKYSILTNPKIFSIEIFPDRNEFPKLDISLSSMPYSYGFRYEIIDNLVVLGKTYSNVMVTKPSENIEYYYSKKEGLLRAVSIDHLGNDTLTFELDNIIWN